MKTLFIEARSDHDIVKAIQKNIKTIQQYSKIGLFTTVQHIGQINDVKKYLTNNNIEVQLSDSIKTKNCQGPKATYVGQVLGCDATASKKMNVDAFLYIGTGEFHPIAISLETDKPVLKINPFSVKLEVLSEQYKRKWLARQAARISKIGDAKKIGILLSTKPGQYKPNLAKKIQTIFPDSYLFISDMITAENMLNFLDIDVWVNTACPRLVEDSWPKTLINAEELI